MLSWRLVMSFHRPQDRHRDHKEQLQQQYREARDKMSHAEFNLPLDEDGTEGSGGSESKEARKARFEQAIEDRLDQTGKQIRRERERESGKAGS
jgi:hypothetical protein